MVLLMTDYLSSDPHFIVGVLAVSATIAELSNSRLPSEVAICNRSIKEQN